MLIPLAHTDLLDLHSGLLPVVSFRTMDPTVGLDQMSGARMSIWVNKPDIHKPVSL